MKRGMYSAFWLGGGILTLPGWFTKGYAFAPQPKPAEPLPTPDELERYAQLPFAERQAYEAHEAGEVFTLRPDTQDTKRERKQHKRAA